MVLYFQQHHHIKTASSCIVCYNKGLLSSVMCVKGTAIEDEDVFFNINSSIYNAIVDARN